MGLAQRMPERSEKHGAIGSMSFMPKESLVFKHKNTRKSGTLLEHGSLLVMKDETQDFWLHRLPPTKIL